MTNGVQRSDEGELPNDVKSFVLSSDNVVPYLVRRRILSDGLEARVRELPGGVSATVLTVRTPSVAVVVKQALARLKVDDEWRAKQERSEIEAAAMQLCDLLTPGRVPVVRDNDPSVHVIVMELIPPNARNWQSEVEAGRAHADVGGWAGETLGLWHAQTAGDAEVGAAFADYESFEQLRLSPFHQSVVERLPEAAEHVTPRIDELRERRCFVHGDYAMKNTLVGPERSWVLDFEVAHYGNPIFDLGFFLSFVVLSAVRWPALQPELRVLADRFVRGYADAVGEGFAGSDVDVTAHTGCLVLARTDGKSPAQFLNPQAREHARGIGFSLLRTPEQGLWQWT